MAIEHAVIPSDTGRGGSFLPARGSVRRLASILAADISGYSRLMQVDEEGTHARVTRQRREIIEPSLAEHYGKLITYTGDGFLAMFDSPVEAVRCAIVIQQNMVGVTRRCRETIGSCIGLGFISAMSLLLGPQRFTAMASTLRCDLRELRRPERSMSRAASTSKSKTNWSAPTNRWAIGRLRTSPIRSASISVLPDPAALSHARRGVGRWRCWPLW